MPLGNGDIALNAWVEQGGDLLFYISKSDAWSENVRLLKLGRIRIHITPNPFTAGQPFRQVLRLSNGEIDFSAGMPAVDLRLWVDANRPVIHLEAAGSRPFSLTATLEDWRSRDRALTGQELFSAYGMGGAPHPVIVHADTILQPRQNQLIWFHRNPTSIWPETLSLQGLAGWTKTHPDPLLNRTFGALMQGRGLIATDLTALQSRRPARRFTLSIYPLTATTDSPAAWVRDLEASVRKVDAVSLNHARALHHRWWNDFWNRSWIRITFPPGAAAPSNSGPITSNSLPLRIGADSQGKSAFPGDLADVRLYNRALTAAAIRRDAAATAPAIPTSSLVGDWDFAAAHDGVIPNRANPGLPAKVMGNVQFVPTAKGMAAHFDGKGWLEIASSPELAPKSATLEAWIRPDALPSYGGRIIDKTPVGGDSGFLLDLYGGLRLITHGGTLTKNPHLPIGRWSHVAATIDQSGVERLYVNGRRIANQASASVTPRPELIPQGYALQRFIAACAGRGAYPIKFNGSLFTVDATDGGQHFDADYRRWGGPYWFQNTRLPYWPMLASGDFDMMRPLFNMYLADLSFAEERTRVYFGHPGAFFPETMYFFGAYANENYGWDRKGKPASHVDNTYIRWYYSGGLELTAMGLDDYAYTQDAAFLHHTLLPLARAILTFYDRHYPRDANGKLILKPAQSLETWQNVINPLPAIAGLRYDLDRLIALPHGAITAADRAAWTRLRAQIPPIPMKNSAAGPLLSPAETILGPRSNVENPELYAIFPYRLYKIGTPGLAIGRRSFVARKIKGSAGWQQDPIQAAFLGLTDEAARDVAERFSAKNPGSRFPAFWGPNFDWIPDQDHGSVALMALQSMILQAEGRKLYLLPAWPHNWNVSFKLHAPYNTTVEGGYRSGKLEKLRVSPAARAKDVVRLIPSTGVAAR